MARRRRSTHRKHPTSGKSDDGPDELQLLGVYGRDFDDSYACIVGFTAGGAPYGVTWEEAAYLRDCPEVVAWLGEERCEQLWGEETTRARKAQRARLDRTGDPDHSPPF